jgi:hypothetical protein
VHHRRKLFVGPVSAPTFRPLVPINSAPLYREWFRAHKPTTVGNKLRESCLPRRGPVTP